MGRGYSLGITILALVLLVAALRFVLPSREISQTPATIISYNKSNMTNSTFTLSSKAFEDGASIPSLYTCDANRDLSPALVISGTPEGTKSLALVMDDPDIPKEVRASMGIEAFDHWVLFDLPADTHEIPEGGISTGTIGLNSSGSNAYTGPCPPPQYEPSEHRYVFVVYALDTVLGMPASTTKALLTAAMEGHIIAQAQLVGRYKRREAGK